MEQEHTNRPSDKAICQQKLRAWKPLMKFKDASIFFLVTGVIILVMGIIMSSSDSNVAEYTVEYTNCLNVSNNVTCSSLPSTSCTCAMPLNVTALITGPVYFYYGLTTFYQNHRQLINSMDINQLMGATGVPANACSPFQVDALGRFYAPCGEMANVIFNDSFSVTRASDNSSVPWTNKGIALQSDLARYGNPGVWNGTVAPINWAAPINTTYAKGYADAQDLMVWMRPAALPSFRKLHHIMTATGDYASGLPKNNYVVYITYNYPVTTFGGQKFFIVSNVSWLGGKNQALWIVYLITGIVEIIIGIILLILHFKLPVESQKTDSIILATDL